MPDLSQVVWLIPLLPILAAGGIALSYLFSGNRGESGERLTARMALVAGGLSLLLILLIDLQAVMQGTPGQIQLGQWLASGALEIPISFTLDGLGLVMTTLVGSIGLLTLQLIHAQPGKSWTVDRLAGEVGMSRSRFAERFSALVGQGPMAYLAEWRLQKALALLQSSPASSVAILIRSEMMVGLRSRA